MRLHLFFLISILSFQAWATLSNVSVSSYAKPVSDGKSLVTIYVGKAKVNGDSTSTSDDPQDTCSELTSFCSTTAFSCNENSIYGSLYLTVSFQTDAAASITATSKIYIQYSTTSIAAAVQPTSFATGTLLTAKFKWSDICALNSSTDTLCDLSFSKAFKIGISNDSGSTLVESFSLQTNFRNVTTTASAFHTDCSDTVNEASNQGVCRFDISPGDSKVYVSNIKIPSTWPTPAESASGITFSGVRVYFQTAATDTPAGSATASSNEWCNIAPTTAGYTELPVASDGGMQKTTVKNLDNEQTYVFLIATYDQAGNLTNFSNVLGSSFYTPGSTGNIHYGKPGEVVGLLDGKKCFVATAAYGSEMDPQVEIFRQFRSQILLKSELGRAFVKWYYSVSPPAAEWIRHSEILRTTVRGILWPLLTFAKFSLEFGFLTAVFGLLFVFLLIRQLYRKLVGQWRFR